jgi:hypothetical protein
MFRLTLYITTLESNRYLQSIIKVTLPELLTVMYSVDANWILSAFAVVAVEPEIQKI